MTEAPLNSLTFQSQTELINHRDYQSSVFYGPAVEVAGPRCDAGQSRDKLKIIQHTHRHTHTGLTDKGACKLLQHYAKARPLRIEKHWPFTKSFFSSTSGEDKLSKLAPQILTRRNWWSPACCQSRGAPEHTVVGFRGFPLIYFCYLFVQIS